MAEPAVTCNERLHVELKSTLRLQNGGHCDKQGCAKSAGQCPEHKRP